MPSQTPNEISWDVFISHASEDKVEFVKPLAEALATYGAKVWYDEFTLSVGDSLSRSIDKGLAKCKFGVVVLSTSFLKKDWPEYELKGLTAKEIGNYKVILPIWHNIERNDILAYSPTLADKKAISSSENSPDKIALQLLETIRPDLFTRILKKIAYWEAISKAKTELRDPKKLKMGPARHEQLSKDLLGRIRLIRAALWGAYSHSMDFWVEGFKRDMHPSREIAWWEHVAACYTEVSKLTPLTREQHVQAFDVIYALCNGIEESNVSQEISALPEEAMKKIRNIVPYRLPVYDIVDQFPKESDEIPKESPDELAEYDIEHFPMK